MLAQFIEGSWRLIVSGKFAELAEFWSLMRAVIMYDQSKIDQIYDQANTSTDKLAAAQK